MRSPFPSKPSRHARPRLGPGHDLWYRFNPPTLPFPLFSTVAARTMTKDTLHPFADKTVGHISQLLLSSMADGVDLHRLSCNALLRQVHFGTCRSPLVIDSARRCSCDKSGGAESSRREGFGAGIEKSARPVAPGQRYLTPRRAHIQSTNADLRQRIARQGLHNVTKAGKRAGNDTGYDKQRRGANMLLAFMRASPRVCSAWAQGIPGVARCGS